MRVAARRLAGPSATAAGVTSTEVPVRLQGVEYRLHGLRLRLNDPQRITPNGQRLFEIADVVRQPRSWQIAHSTFDQQKGLEVRWADGNASLFPSDWLESHVASTLADTASNDKIHPDTYLWNSRFRTFLPELTYTDVCTVSGKRQLSSHLVRYGLALIRDVPCEPGMVTNVGNEIGYVRATNYGSLFDVIDLGAQGNNLAQTNCRILAHTDNPYRDPFPGVQMLHCLNNATEGGATSFTDGFAAAEVLRHDNPAAFDLLSRHPHPFEYRDPTQGVLLRTRAPVIGIDAHGRLQRICFNNRSAGVIDLPPNELEEYYKAWAAFDELCNSDDRVLKVQLKPGDLIMFSNSRIMHGREEYTAGAGRHIQGCYIDHDAVRSRVDWATTEQHGFDPIQCDVHLAATEATIAALQTQEEFCYGEGVNMLQHGLQAAQCARLHGEPPAAILAALMHDVGNAPQARDAWEAAGNPAPQLLVSPSDNSIGYRHHASIGSLFLDSLGFSPEVTGAVQLHVSAKRALVAMDPSYMNELSQASIDTLAYQGGPFSEKELAAFRATPGSDVALRLRRYDDLGKEHDVQVPQLESYRGLIYEHLRAQSAGI